MTLNAILDIIGVLTGLAGAVLAVMGAFHSSRLPRRSFKTPMVRETFAACLLLGICNLAALLRDYPATASKLWMTDHVVAAGVFFGLAVNSYVRSRHGNSLKAGGLTHRSSGSLRDR